MSKFSIMLALLLLATGISEAGSDTPPGEMRAPVLVELFTSEGCSSCPPADALLQQLDRAHPATAQLIVLSEHVDYWNRIGWNDPYSSSFFSDRQNAYAGRFRLEGAYTPQMVVDGNAEFLGSDSRLAVQAIEKARIREKIGMRISSITWKTPNTLQVHVEAGPLPEPLSGHKVNIFLAAALDHAESDVLRGENQGRHLSHVAVVLSLNKIGAMEKGASFARDTEIKLDARRDLSNLRVIAFAQESGPGLVVGAAMQHVGK